MLNSPFIPFYFAFFFFAHLLINFLLTCFFFLNCRSVPLFRHGSRLLSVVDAALCGCALSQGYNIKVMWATTAGVFTLFNQVKLSH